jgi:uncharacterized membrane protein
MTPESALPARLISKHRTEGLVDGIYAVAMTLLVLELKIPETMQLTTAADFHHALAHLLPKGIAWLISFFILATFWISHQRAFHYVRHVDSKLLWINVVSLLFASLLPFSSALVGEHAQFFSAQVFYAANMSALALVAIWQIGHLAKHPELCQAPVPWYVAKAVRFRCFSIVAVAALAVAIAWFNPYFGTTAFMLMAVLGRLGRRMETREAEKAALLSSDRPFP